MVFTIYPDGKTYDFALVRPYKVAKGRGGQSVPRGTFRASL